MTCSRLPDELALEDLPDAAGSWLYGCPGSGLSDSESWEVFQNWLIWSQGDGHATRRQWSYLQAKGFQDRDEYVLRLWKSVDREGGENAGTRQHIERELAPWDYYRRHFFGWFLGRFNLAAARRVFSDRWLVVHLHWIFVSVAMIATVLALRVGGWEPALAESVEALLAVVVIGCGLIWWLRLSLPLYAFCYSLIPRLGVAVGIGYLFLASAAHLVRAIATSPWSDDRLWLTALCLVGATFLYVPVHISRRVYPPPHWRVLFERSTEIVALGIGYAALELLVFAPFFFTEAFLGPGDFEKGPPQLALCGAVALILGVILQLAWDEKPLTEPL